MKFLVDLLKRCGKVRLFFNIVHTKAQKLVCGYGVVVAQ